MKYKLACSLFISSRCERELYCCYSLFTRAPSYLPHVCTISVTLREPRTCRYDASSPFSLHTRPYKTPIENAMRYRNRGDEPRRPAGAFVRAQPPARVNRWTYNSFSVNPKLRTYIHTLQFTVPIQTPIHTQVRSRALHFPS